MSWYQWIGIAVFSYLILSYLWRRFQWGAKLSRFWEWNKFSGMLIGVPLIWGLLFLGLQKFAFTVQCKAVGKNCEEAWGADEALVTYMGDLLAANPNVDIVAKRR